MKQIRYILPLFLAAMVSCSKEDSNKIEPETPDAPVFTLTASIGGDVTKTAMGQEADGKYPVSWTAGDKISVNGVESAEAVIADDAKTATFAFGKDLGTDGFKAVYPASAWKKDGVTVPTAQTYKAETFDPESAIMAAYSEDAEGLNFKHLMAYLVLSFDTEYGDTDKIKTITVKSNGNEPMCGDFSVDFMAESPALTPVADAGAAAVTVDCGEEGLPLKTEVVVAVPAQTYASGIEITTEDVNGHRTTRTLKSEFAPKAGTVYSMPINFDYYPGTNLKLIKVGDLLWAPVYCGYSKEHPNGLLYQYGRAVGQPYYPAATTSSVCKSGPASSPEDAYFYKVSSGNWYGGEALTGWPMSESDAGYVEGKIANPCPEGWRLPTTSEFQGLLDIGFTQSENWAFSYSDNWTEAQQNASVVQAGFTIKDGSGLFFAAVGGRTGAGLSFYRSNEDGYARIWASDRSNSDMTKASCLAIQRTKYSVAPDGFNAKIRNDYTVAGGLSVRCVKDAK
mgnify:CR=1 FL=1